MELDEVYRKYFHTVYKYSLSLTRNPETAEEVSQETFFKAIEKIDDFKGECSIQTWLCEIARNTYFKLISKNKSQENYINQKKDLLKQAEKSPEEILLQKEDQMQMHQILHQLKEPYKEVAMLRIFSELSLQEIAQLFGKSESWARVTYMRARRMMQEEYQNENRT